MRRKESFHSFFRAGKKEEGGVCLPSWQTKLKPTDGSSNFWGGEGERRNGRRKKTQNSILFFSFQGGYERWTLGARKERRKVDPCARVIRPLSTRPSSLPPASST